MAKELPYYKHEPSEWLEGEIQICSDEAIVCFINLCSGYWLKLGCMSYAFALQKYCRRNANILQELIDAGMVDKNDDEIRIKFLDKQLSEFNNLSGKRSEAAKKRWADANALQVDSKSNAIREDKKRGDEKKEDKERFIIEQKSLFAEQIKPYSSKYSSQMLNDFYVYWSEPNQAKTKLKYQMQETWDLSGRLATWKRIERNDKPKQSNKISV